MSLTQSEITIVARCTPRGQGALALIRLSGTDAWGIASKIGFLGEKKDLLSCQSHTVHYGKIVFNETLIDEVMFILMRGPKTFTGEDIVEITCHNNPFIIDAIIAAAEIYGARIARRGEFAERAFLNGKIDLLKAEAIHELIQAQTEIALKTALSQVRGSLSTFIFSLEERLIKTLAWCEASFEFLDEGGDFGPDILHQLRVIKADIQKILTQHQAQQHIRQGFRIALIGSVNAGKSSLFNALTKQKRAIVTPIAGTTRDSIEMTVYRYESAWTFVDTAGVRNTEDIVEQEGIERSYQEAAKADCILLIIDQSRELSESEQHIYDDLLEKYQSNCLLVYTKSDLPAILSPCLYPDIKRYPVSTVEEKNIAELEKAIHELLTRRFALSTSPYLINERQLSLLRGVNEKLDECMNLLDQTDVPYELLSIQLRQSIEYVGELTGKTVSESALDKVFKEFCVGK
jgi:tRNA modification GTPase